MESSAFSRLIEAVNQVNDLKNTAEKEANALQEQLMAMRNEAIDTQFKMILDGIGIQGVVFHAGQVTIEGIHIQWKPESVRSYPQYYPLVLNGKQRDQKPALDTMVMDEYLSGKLIITSDLDQAYRHTNYETSNWQRVIKLQRQSDNVDWIELAARVGNTIIELQREKAEAPANKAAREAEHQRRRDEERKHTEEAVRQYKIDQEAREQQRKEWEAQEFARREHEAQLRAEVAGKFGVSGEAFEYLIERLADELERRNRGNYYE